MDAIQIAGGWRDPSINFYTGTGSSKIHDDVVAWLGKRLPKSIDCILLWETPDSYLRAIYPDALIVSQMPGSFARAPYPKTTVFDPIGLYKKGALHQNALAIMSDQNHPDTAVGRFKLKARQIFSRYPYRTKRSLIAASGADRLSVLPLQISGHYAFQGETGFLSQSEFALAAVQTAAPENAVLVTEYVSRLYSDKVMSPDFLKFLSRKNERVLYFSDMENIPSITQHLLQYADELLVATSGLAFQAMIWDVPVKVIGNTWLSPFGHQAVHTTADRDKILDFTLLKHQPLTSLITDDGDFLVALLEELHSRQNAVGIERLASLPSIDTRYEDRLLGHFREREVQKVFQSKALTFYGKSKDDAFHHLLNKTSPKLISFDLFDTLVTRGFENPADLYRFMELEFSRRGIVVPFDFAEKRLSAELLARANATTEEISLKDIYVEFCLAENLPQEMVDTLSDLEIEIEINAARRRPIGTELYEEAQRRRIPICITSDMYLPRRCIDGIIEKTGYTYKRLYLSSEIGLTKKHGTLFDFIMTDRKLSGPDMVHVGDNAKTDIQPAKKRGITTFHVPRAAISFSRHEEFKTAFPKRPPIAGLARSVTAAAIANRLFDDPRSVSNVGISDSDPWQLGYAALGPLVFGFANWVRSSAIEHEVSHLHFLSREGKLIKDVFDRIDRENPSGVASNYLWGSRRAIRVAQLQNFSDIIEIAGQTINPTATLRRILTQRFGLSEDKINLEVVRNSGYTSLEEEIDRSRNGRHKLNALLRFLSDEILSAASEERSVYTAYLEENGLYSDLKPAIVDVGWSANMQGSLGQLLKRPLHGYYIATTDAAIRWKSHGNEIHSYYVEDCANTYNKPILNHRLMVENMLCDTIPSVRRIVRSENGFQPEPVSPSNLERNQLISAIQDGARAFANDVCETLGPLAPSTPFRPDLSLPLLEQFLTRPHPADAELFAGQDLDDTFSGAGKRYYIAPLDENRNPVSGIESNWAPGALALDVRSKALKIENTEKKITSNKTGQLGSGPKAKRKLPVKAQEPERKIEISQRENFVFTITTPIMRSALSKEKYKKLRNNPKSFYKNVKHPALRLIRWLALGK